MTKPMFPTLNYCCKKYAFITVPNELKPTESGFFFETQDCPCCGRHLRLRFASVGAANLPGVCVSEQAEYVFSR